MVVLSLFDGMSCGQLALKGLGIQPTTYFASEIDKYAISVTQKNFPSTKQLGCVTQWRLWDVPWDKVDLILAGSPCQGFSFIGKNLNFEDPRSSLYFTFLEILNHVKTFNPNVKFLLENVVMKKASEDIISSGLETTPLLVDSINFTDQKRSRLYWASCALSAPEPVRTNPTERLNLPPELELATKQYGSWVPRPLSTCIDANYFKGADNHGQRTLVKDGNTYRKLTPEECELLQTVPVGYTAGVSNTQRYKMLGNGWTVLVVTKLLKQLLNA